MAYKNFIGLIEEHIAKVFEEEQLSPPELYDPQRYILSLGGKRIRPLLALVGCDLFEGNIHQAIPSAVSVELFHNFSLVHDDILDKAPLRRGKKTIHKKWNVNIAILSGDALLVKAYQALEKSEGKFLPQLISLFNKTALEVCEGQQLDMNFEKQLHVSVADYENMITKKTAVLIACSLKMGALCAGAKENDANNLYAFGKNLGIAFQLKDDILDVFADGEAFGKQVAGDILSNKKTFLLLKAIELSGARHLQEINYWLVKKKFDKQEKINAIKEIYGQLEIRNYAEKEMQKFYGKACSHLDEIGAGKEKKNVLLGFATTLMERGK